MLTRIVKMQFRAADIADFLALMQQAKPLIQSFEGCIHLSILQDVQEPTVFFTYSHWRNAADLENYRRSELFERVWAQTKTYFAAPPQAWSVQQLFFDNSHSA